MSTLRRSLIDVAYPMATFVVVIAIWEIASRAGLVASYLLPAPSEIVVKLAEARSSLLAHTLVTAVEIVVSFVAALVVGVVLAIGVVYIRPLERAVYPWIIATQVIPKVAIAPLFIVWFGFGLAPKVIIGFLIAFFPILIDTVIGLRSVESESIFLLQSMGAGRWQSFLRLRLPNAAPNIFAGMKVSITLATVGAIVAEFVGANEGLGYVLLFANGIIDTKLLFAALTLISILALVLYLIVSALEHIIIRWHVSTRSQLVSFSA